MDHGGSLGRAKALFPQAPEPFVDLSTGINPHSYPFFDLPATTLLRLPEDSRLQKLKAIAAAAYGAPSPWSVAAAPGTQVLLPLVARLVKPGRATVLSPTYAEHARAAAMAGHGVGEVRDFDALADADLAIVVNPNNPDGRIAERKRLLMLAEKLRAKGGLLIVDEAFMDVGPRGESLCSDVWQGGIVVLRSFGKFFGLAGLRLGFALADTGTASRIAAQLGPWAVSGPALEYGVRALADEAWQNAMRATLTREAARLDELFARYAIPVAGGTALYRYLESPLVMELFSALGRRGILLRHYEERPHILRAGLPGDEREWSRLQAALEEWRGENS